MMVDRPLPDQFLLPDYTDGSIANVPATVAAMLGTSLSGLSPLREPLWQPLADGVKRVVLLIVDAWGWNLLARERENLTSLWQRTAVSGQITSVFPSTTVAALSSLWTGYAPAQHGLVGLRLFFPQQAVMGQLLRMSPTFGRYPDALIEAGLDPEMFLGVPGLGAQLTAAGVEAHAFKGRDIVGSALSQMHDRGLTASHGASSVADLFVQLRQLLAAKAGERMYVAAYWPTVDTLSHIYGWNHSSVRAELRAILSLLETEFLAALSSAARRDTALFILADHGQVVTPSEQAVYLPDHPALEEMLLMRPGGEPRTSYLYTKYGRQQAVIDYINGELGHAMIAVPAAEALAAGWLGPQPHAAETADRVGNVIAIMREGYTLHPVRKEKKKEMFGRHGGLTRDEMVVPWLGIRLDA